MRKDENGEPCPETLGEYRDYVSRLMGEDNKAVEFLDNLIVKSGREEKVIASDSQMRNILYPMMIERINGK